MSMDFRSRSADVRREAADILWRFRSSRAARRASPGPDAPGVPEDPARASGRPGLPVSPATAELIRSALSGPMAPDVPDAAALRDQVPPAVSDPPPEAEKGTPAPVMPEAMHAAEYARAEPAPELPLPSDDKVVQQHAHAPEDQRVPALDNLGVPDDGSGHSPWTGVDVPEASAATHAAGAIEARDLTDLPGVGAGLVWLLGRCGVHTLADLAAADATQLEQELGLVGQLLDLPSWIDLARQAIESKGTSAQ